MRGEFNQRFGQNSKDRNAHDGAPVSVRGCSRRRTATPAEATRSTRGSTRAAAGYASSTPTPPPSITAATPRCIHTDPDGERDLAHGPNVRVYHFAGTEHGLGMWPPTDIQLAAADPTGAVEQSQNLRGVVDYSALLRAGLVNLDRWVTEGVEPPPSRHPRLADGTAVPPETLAPVFDRDPARALPAPPRAAAPPGLVGTLPPKPGRAFGSLVSAVDADGNEVAGIVLPELAVPVATHTGWTLRHPDIGGAEQLLVFAGATLPFPRTRAERAASGDPRPSLEERYASRDDYLARVREAALTLARAGYLLEDDIELSVAAAARFWDPFPDPDRIHRGEP